MKRIISTLLCLSILTSFVTVNAWETRTREYNKKETYIVVLDVPSVHSEERVQTFGVDDSLYREALLELQAEIKAQIPSSFSARRQSQETVAYSYTDVLNGFTVSCDRQTAEYIKTLDGVKNVFRDSVSHIVPTDTGVEFYAESGEDDAVSSANAGNMINVGEAYDSGYDGSGSVIAVIDSFVNINHNFFTQPAEETAELSKEDVKAVIDGGLSVSNVTISNAYKSTKFPFVYNYANDSATLDTSSLHGNHVTGIAAGGNTTLPDGKISGIAPEAQVLFFGVAGEGGGASDSSIIAAIDDAVKFKSDVINLSLGSTGASENGFYEEYQTIVKNAKNAGCSVVFSAGNSGRYTYQASYVETSTSDNRNYKNSSKVASVQNEYAYMPYLTDDAENKYPCGVLGTKTVMNAKEIADVKNGTTQDFNEVNVSGKAAFITLPDFYLTTNVENYKNLILSYAQKAINKGADAVIVASNYIDVADGNYGAGYPLFSVSYKTGEEILKNASTLAYSGQKAILKRTDDISANGFSSYGTADNLDIAIDFAAVGGNVYSSYGHNTYSNLSGTSMAAPQVSGATALMHKYAEDNFPDFSGAEKVSLVKSLLASTASTVYDEKGVIESPHKVGAGLINLADAMSTKVILSAKNSTETKINLDENEEKSNQLTIEFTAYNLGKETVEFESAEVEIASDDYKFYEQKGNGAYGRKALTKTVTGDGGVSIPAGESVNIALTVTLSNEELSYLESGFTNGFFIDGKVTLAGSTTNCDVGIPFSSFYGDWEKMSPLTTGAISQGRLEFSTLAEDGFSPGMMLSVSGGAVNMPMTENPDETIKESSVTVFSKPYRNCFYSIKIDGVEVYEEEFYFNKYEVNGYYLGYKTVGDLSKAKEIEIVQRLPHDIEGKETKSFKIKVVPDNEKAEIQEILTVTEDGRKYASLNVTDNFGISSATLLSADASFVPQDAYIDSPGVTSATCTFDITDVSDAVYYVYDKAMNLTAVLPEVSIEVKGNTASFKNNTQSTVSGVAMVAVYDENDKMTGFLKLDEAVTLGEYEKATFDVSSYDGKKYKLFFWKDTDTTCAPLCESYSSK